MLRFVWILALTVPLAAQTVHPRHTTCHAGQLSVTEDRKPADRIDPEGRHQAMTVAIVNRSASPCEVRGMPDVTFSGAEGAVMAVRVCANCDDELFRPQPSLEVVIEPNHAAYVVIGYDTDEGNGPCRSAGRLDLRLPKDEQTLEMSLGRGWRSCGRVDVTPFLDRPPVNGFLPNPGVANDR